LILAPRGRDAAVAVNILADAGLRSHVCQTLHELIIELQRGAETAIVTEEATRDVAIRDLSGWVNAQPPWSDFPFIILTEHGGGIERNPAAAELMRTLGNVTFIERPFHPTTLISVVQTNLRGRQRQYECQRLNEMLESRVHERTEELAAANRQLLNQIEERERVEATLRQMQRLEAVGQLTSGVAHDFNNLLTVVLGNLQFLERDLKAAGVDSKSLQRLSYMRTAAERGAKLTDQLLTFSRRKRLQPKPLDLNDAVLSMRDLLQSTMGGSIEIQTRLETGLWPAFADPTQIELAILNLAINARDAMPKGGCLTVSTRNAWLSGGVGPEDPPAGEYVEVSVSDTGTGMSEDVRSKAFEPFFTTKEIGKGSGLGLSQVLGFAKQSSGGVRIDSKQGSGTSVRIYLPRAEHPAVEVKETTAPPAEQGNPGGTILLVDDDRAVRDVTAAMLRDLGYAVLEAGSGGAALDIVEHEGQIDLVVMDFAMPGMNGAEVARRTQARRPNLPVLFVTGFADRAALAGVEEDHILGKPFANHDLAYKVRFALAHRRARSRPSVRFDA
jgi:signal transduction histidine kinase/CheY-like chemotaxis protein